MLGKTGVFILPCVVSVIAAAVMMWFEKDGWGWLVFLAIVTFVYPQSKERNHE